MNDVLTSKSFVYYIYIFGRYLFIEWFCLVHFVKACAALTVITLQESQRNSFIRSYLLNWIKDLFPEFMALCRLEIWAYVQEII